MQALSDFLRNPLVALFVGLVFGALAISGKFSVLGANILLFCAFGIGSFGVLNAGVRDYRLVVAAVLGIATGCLLLSYWIGPTTSSGPPPTAAYSMSDLRLSMLGGDVFIPHASDVRTYTGIVIDAEVWNTGAPSAVVKWALMVIPKGKPPVSGQLTIIPKSLSLTGQYNNDVIYGADALDQKTRAKPVSTTPIVGKLLFYVYLEKSVVVAPSTRLELSATDIYERETTVSQIMGEWLQR
jgi:hypothetical protein